MTYIQPGRCDMMMAQFVFPQKYCFSLWLKSDLQIKSTKPIHSRTKTVRYRNFTFETTSHRSVYFDGTSSILSFGSKVRILLLKGHDEGYCSLVRYRAQPSPHLDLPGIDPTTAVSSGTPPGYKFASAMPLRDLPCPISLLLLSITLSVRGLVELSLHLPFTGVPPCLSTSPWK